MKYAKFCFVWFCFILVQFRAFRGHCKVMLACAILCRVKFLYFAYKIISTHLCVSEWVCLCEYFLRFCMIVVVIVVASSQSHYILLLRSLLILITFCDYPYNCLHVCYHALPPLGCFSSTFSLYCDAVSEPISNDCLTFRNITQ